MTVAISWRRPGAKAVICASTATPAPAPRLRGPGRIPARCSCARKIAIGKLAQALVHGARLLQVRVRSMTAWSWPRNCRRVSGGAGQLVNPDRLQGQKRRRSRS